MNEDLRVHKTNKNIRKNFFELLKEYQFKDITVKMIVERAEINPSTFYRHYEDKYALLEELVEDNLCEMRKVVDSRIVVYERSDEAAGRRYIRPLVDFFDRHKEEFYYTVKNAPFVNLPKRLTDVMDETFDKRMQREEHYNNDKIIYTLYSKLVSNNIMTVMEWWQLENTNLSPEEITELLVKYMKFWVKLEDTIFPAKEFR